MAQPQNYDDDNEDDDNNNVLFLGGRGHVGLGRNGSGKMLLSLALASSAATTREEGGEEDDDNVDSPPFFLHSGLLTMQWGGDATSAGPTHRCCRDHCFLSCVSFKSRSN